MKSNTELGVELYIVIADDNIDDHGMIMNAVKSCNLNHIVTSVYNGEQLLNLLLRQGFYKTETSSSPDVIILNLELPVLDGISVLEEIKKYPELKDIPTYTFSDPTVKDAKMKAASLGSRQHFSKPLNTQELSGLVAAICNEAASLKKQSKNSQRKK